MYPFRSLLPFPAEARFHPATAADSGHGGSSEFNDHIAHVLHFLFHRFHGPGQGFQKSVHFLRCIVYTEADADHAGRIDITAVLIEDIGY